MTRARASAAAVAVTSGMPLYAGPNSMSKASPEQRGGARVVPAERARSRAPVLKSPALKKYGLTRPDLSVKSPKRSTPSSRQSADEVGLVHAVLYTVASMRIVTLNANGIRSAARKGLFDWLPSAGRGRRLRAGDQGADATSSATRMFRPPGYHSYYFDASKKGYSGVAIYSRRQAAGGRAPAIGSREFDAEGRYIEARFKDLSVVSVYLPSGSSSEERQRAKFRFMAEFMPYLRSLKRKRRNFILCGDWNIAHKQIDLRNWRVEPEELGIPARGARLARRALRRRRATSTRSARRNPEPDQYTWWSNRGQAWSKNVGWRIDYQVAEPEPQGQRARGRHPQGAALLRPRAAHHRLRPVSASGISGRRRAQDRRAVVARLARRDCRLPASARAGDAVSRLLRRTPLHAGVHDAVGVAARARHRSHDHRHAVLGGARLHAQVLLGTGGRPAAAARCLGDSSGRRRSWMLLAQIGIAIGLVNIAHTDAGRYTWARSRASRCSWRFPPRRRTSRSTRGASRRRRSPCRA